MFSRKLKLNFEIFSLNSLCFPSGQEKYDPCAKFVRHANRNFKLHYAPYQELSIDESLIGTYKGAEVKTDSDGKKFELGYNVVNITFLPTTFFSNIDLNELKYFRNNDVLFCAYPRKKSVKNLILLISTKSVDQNVTIIKKQHSREKHSTKPVIVYTSYGNVCNYAS
ncbi:piggyBac transposable element-derived protein 4-like [Vespula maculifrons]|uniref:PiggyBac transposable element-derived protein 4-like n=1 Tax=Vespula maculifrons TaxID=7453 RepID=A0ABD2ASM2_VESMC